VLSGYPRVKRGESQIRKNSSGVARSRECQELQFEFWVGKIKKQEEGGLETLFAKLDGQEGFGKGLRGLVG